LLIPISLVVAGCRKQVAILDGVGGERTKADSASGRQGAISKAATERQANRHLVVIPVPTHQKR